MKYVGYLFDVDKEGIEFDGVSIPKGYDIGDTFELTISDTGCLILKRIKDEVKDE